MGTYTFQGFSDSQPPLEIVIPPNINQLSLEEHLLVYARCGWRTQPVYPWDADCADPGKQPKWTLERRLRASQSEIIRHFREHPNDNVGLVPAVPNLAVDFDDPDPRGSGIRAIRELYPQLFSCPYVRARRGPHFHLICPDAPPSLTKLTVTNFKGLGVNIELYGAPSCNIILPPSIHPYSKPGNLVRYTWWSSGRLLVVAYLSLVGMFGFKTNSVAPTQSAHTKDWNWLKNYRIDFRLLDFVKCWQLLGRYGRRIDDPDTKRVRHSVQCPWIDKHTDNGRPWTPENSSTVIFVEEGHYPEFHCSHTTYCADCGLKEVVEWMERERPGILEECCTCDYQPKIGASYTAAQSPMPGPTGVQVENELPPCPYDPVDWGALRAKVAIDPAGRFVQKAIFPPDSILTPYMTEARTCCESADIYLLGSILPVCTRLLARTVYAEWGTDKLYPNLFELLIGSAGMRKTSAIRCAKRVAWNCLPPEAFLSAKQSVEALFAEYCADEGGSPDKLMLVEEGNTLMATWSKSDYGARVAAEFLQLYDCAELTESFLRNKSKTSGPKRTVPETSTSVVIGGTFGVATFPLEQVKEGIARRFMYGVAETLGRTIYWPERLPSLAIADLFKPLLNLSGEIQMPREGEVWNRWVAYQDQNRKLINEIGTDNEVLAARLTSTPSQVLKVAMNYEACRAVHTGWPGWPVLKEFTLAGLESAIGFVEEHLRAAAFLDQYGCARLLKNRPRSFWRRFGEISGRNGRTPFS
jgi:Bifunctional DNA primase/polymerase, N-terminal